MPSITEQCALACRMASRQHQLTTRSQLLDAGITKSQIHEWQATTFLTHVERGVFLVAGGRLTWRAKLLACCLVTGGVASHRSAAALHGLGRWRGGRPELTIPVEESFHRDDIRLHRSTDLHLTAPVLRDAIPTTPVDRTVLDLGAVAPYAVEDAVLDAMDRRLTSWPDLFATLVAHSRRGRRGCGPLRAVLDQHYGDDTDSQLERRLFKLIRLARLPLPSRQVEVHDEHGFVMRLDFAYPHLRIGIEADSRQHHANHVAFEEDRIKRNRLAVAGWLLLLITDRRIRRRPTSVCEEIARALRSREPQPPAFFGTSGLRGSPG